MDTQQAIEDAELKVEVRRRRTLRLAIGLRSLKEYEGDRTEAHEMQITEMTEDLWRSEQILEDYERLLAALRQMERRA